MKTLTILFVACCIVLPVQATAPAPTTVDDFDIARYLGRWYQIALIPNRFQANCVAETVAEYSREATGRIQVVNSCRDSAGETLRVLGEVRVNSEYADSARLQVRFAPRWLSWLEAVWGDYWVIALHPDYAWALVGSPDHEYLWLLARTSSVSERTYRYVTEIAENEGYATSQLKLESPRVITR